MSGIIYGIKNDNDIDKNNGHNYAGESKLSESSSLSQIFVDYSLNIESHKNFE